MERQRGQQQRRRPPWRRLRIRGRRSEIPYAERQAGISCLSGRFSCRLLRHRSDAAARLGFSDAYSDTKFKLPAECSGAGTGEVFFCGTENNRRDVGPNFCSIRQKVHSSENGALFRKHPDRMRIWSGCDGSVLLSVRP